MDNTPTQYAHKAMEKALESLKEEAKAGRASRENSLAITNLQQAMMWNNNDRTIKGELKPYDTHQSGQ
jgi:hypothetical protein